MLNPHCPFVRFLLRFVIVNDTLHRCEPTASALCAVFAWLIERAVLDHTRIEMIIDELNGLSGCRPICLSVDAIVIIVSWHLLPSRAIRTLLSFDVSAVISQNYTPISIICISYV